MKSVLKYYAKLDALLDAQIFFIALELDMFTVLANGKTAEEAEATLRFNAGKYGSLNLGNAQSLKVFLDVLTAQGLIILDGNRYCNTGKTQRFLSRSSLSYIGDVLLYRKRLSDICNEAEVVSDNPSSCPVFDFTEMARITAKEISILRKQPLLTLIKELGIMPKKVLDLGGGSGALLIAIAESYTKCEGVLFEQKDVAAIARRFIADSPAKNRIAIMEGNFLLDGIGEDYDFIIASGIFPFVPEMIEPFVKKISDALQEGGLLLVYDTAFAAEKDKARYAARWLKGNLRRKNQQLRRRALRDENFRINKALLKEILISALNSVSLKAITKGTDGLYPFIVFRKVCSDK
ncbi:methyltransferase domain-containing protein [Treponema parvum]|uniref:Methyltransferase domain-containing protein n=1 Tax=Treponema parvum TaxID=138851 RepID=A0A975IFF8_9SPIR|nr:methyltransferase [Treponema parvum]QTQ14294.1 methyltransferase domain-containing protein [Treponema parvum]